MNIKNSYAGIMTADIEAAQNWYAELLNRKPDSHPMDSLYEWHFPEGGGLQVFEDKDRAGFSSITLFVEDLKKISKNLTDKGIRTGGISRGDITKTMIVLDPENNRIAFAESS